MNFKEWYNQTLASEHTPEKLRAAEHGWNGCKQEMLKILSQPLKNLDLSEDYCEQRYIDKIKEL